MPELKPLSHRRYQVQPPFTVAFTAKDDEGYSSPNPFPTTETQDLERLKREVRKAAQHGAPGVYVITDHRGVPCSTFDAFDKVPWKKDPIKDPNGLDLLVPDYGAHPSTWQRHVTGSNLSWAR